jgi:2-polyprenyl-3-methyl-5-hydroxy-6-metoxy-1,4-benzoquinol methylase
MGAVCELCRNEIENHAKYQLKIPFKDKYEIDVYYCDDCGFGFQHPKIENNLGIDYMNNRWTSSDDYVNIKSDKSKKRVEKYCEIIKNIRKPEDKNILDFGCGNGHFLMEMKNSFDFVCGIEESDTAVEINKINKISVFNSISETNKIFDIITMWDVIEHLYDLKNTIKNILEHLSPNGKIIIETANYNTNKIYLLTHYWYFTVESVLKLFNLFGNFNYNVVENSKNIIVVIERK